jgi:hypothetical protein
MRFKKSIPTTKHTVQRVPSTKPDSHKVVDGALAVVGVRLQVLGEVLVHLQHKGLPPQSSRR